MPQEKKKLFIGLREEEVQQRIAEGKINKTDDQTTRSVKQIVKSNVLTFFNLLNVILFALVITTGSFKNMFFYRNRCDQYCDRYYTGIAFQKDLGSVGNTDGK